MVSAAHRRDAPPRRGMLLLLVLGILSLFLVVGAVGVLMSIRARESARAFAAASSRQAGYQSVARAQLDEALLRLIRGSNPAGVVTESLLEDKYGASSTCSVTAIAGAGTPYLTVTVSGLDTTNPFAVAGRLITFDPDPRDPTGPTSYRILRPGSAANTLLVANVKPVTPLPLPTVFPCSAVINGREFSDQGTNEPYDAFDDKNPFLTQPALQGSNINSIARPAFGAFGSANCTVDNDGDGVPDGVWLQNALPAQGAPGGGTLTFDVSYLVLDLDGRINLNAHGSFVRGQTPQTTAQYPNDPATVPVGLGYGPADVDAAAILAGQAAGSTTNRWAILLQGGTVTQNAITSSDVQWRPTPPVDGASQPGRYGLGSAAQPGGSTVTGANPLNADAWMGGNSPTDLKARLQQYTVTTGGTPSLRFVRPGPAWANPDTDDVLGTGSAAHPYRMRLDVDAPRAAGAGADDAPYTVGELERILRSFDADAATLAPRLAAILDDYADRSRMTVTTDGWDTPATTGAAWTVIANSYDGTDPYVIHSPEVVAGLRFNVNRPIGSGTAADRQDYFRQLYTLLRLQAPTPPTGSTVAQWSAALAQWAANVVEFRDADSIMTWFPYDPFPFDGSWTPGSNGVWGAERPELMIRMSTGSSQQFSTIPPQSRHWATVRLFRPWNAQVATGTAATPGGATERIDACLGDATANTLNPRLTQTSGTYPVWRIAYVATEPLANRLTTTATAVGTNTELALSSTLSGTNTSSTALRVRLLRLADPTRPFNTASFGPDRNDYVTVHSAPRVFDQVPSVWLHWPNRDLVSHGELLAVQSGSAANLVDVLFDATKEASVARIVPTVLDATIVPSRFAGAAVSVANAASGLAGTGFENFQHGHFSRWREPGRVNVNTILANTGNTPSALDNAVWTALLGVSGVANPVTAGGSYAPITSGTDLLVSGSNARFTRSGDAANTAFLRQSPTIRLANVATIRSHVFAVWITLRINDSANPGSPKYARVFAVVDRSIPAGYQPGRTLNVRDTIRLQRFLP